MAKEIYKEIHLDAPNIGKLEKEYLNKAIDSGYVSAVGPFVSEFEEAFAEYLGIKKAVSTQSGTAATHMALYELGIGKGDEVIVPVLTFVATVNPIIYVGARPVFVDVDIKTWNIDPAQILKAVTKKTKAIIPVHLHGNPCDMDTILEIAKDNDIYVIEDATESLGAKYKERYTGTFGDFGYFSFNGNKVITTGGGGMIVGRDEEQLRHIKFLINQAKNDRREYYHSEVGFNYRMTNLEAALGLAQMEKLDFFLAKKKKFNDIYRQAFKDIGYIKFQDEYIGSSSSYWLTSIIFEQDIDIAALERLLRKKGIGAKRTFMPITEFAPYKTHRQARYQNSYKIYEKGLCLPSSTLNSEDDIYYVCKRLKELM